MDTNEIRRVKLRQLIDERYGGKVARLAAFLDMKPPQLHRWLSGGQGVHENSARAIERDCGLPPGWLDLPPDAPPPAVPEPSNVSAGPGRLSRVPLISSVQAGMWTEIIDHFQPGEAEAWLECHKNLGPHGYALRVSGDSMTAPMGDYSFPNGMILYVNPSADPVPGKFVIVRRNGHEATFKRLVLVDGELYLEALNPDWPHRYIKLTPDDHICGVVVYAGLEMP